jgi:hypothetical protein
LCLHCSFKKHETFLKEKSIHSLLYVLFCFSFYFYLFIIYLFSDIGDWTQSLTLARQVLYYLIHACNLFGFSLFFRYGLGLIPRPVLDRSSYLYLLRSWDYSVCLLTSPYDVFCFELFKVIILLWLNCLRFCPSQGLHASTEILLYNQSIPLEIHRGRLTVNLNCKKLMKTKGNKKAKLKDSTS